MAKKRMFDKSIIDTDKFCDMPLSAKAMYFIFGMEADDYGFVSPRRVMRTHGGTEDDLKILIAKQFLIYFESGVVIITDWKKNNWLDKRRVVETEFKEELRSLVLFENKYFLKTAKQLLSNGLERIEENSIEENSIEENTITITTTNILNNNNTIKGFNIFDYLQENGFVLNSIHFEVINDWLKKYNQELIKFAVDEAILNNKYNIKYIDSTLFNFEKQNIKTKEQALEAKEEFQNNKQKQIFKKSENKKTIKDYAKELAEELGENYDD